MNYLQIVGDPDQMPHSAASDLGLHCLPISLSGDSRIQWVNYYLIQPNYCTVHLCFFFKTTGKTCGKVCIYLLRVHFKKRSTKDLFDDVYGFFFSDFVYKSML